MTAISKNAFPRHIPELPTRPAPPPAPRPEVLAHRGLDAMEHDRERGHLPALDTALQGHDVLEKWAYHRQLSGMSDEALAAEIAVQQERYDEASTGVDRDPARAKAAAWRLAAAQMELESRKLADPKTPIAEYTAQLTQLSDEQLAAEEKRLIQGIAKVTDPDAVAAYVERLGAVRSERAQRIVDDPKTGFSEYSEALPALSDDAVVAEQAEVKAKLDELVAAGGEPAEIAELAGRLQLLDGEVKRRCTGTEAPAEEPVEGAGAAEPKTETYTIAAGDTLWQLASDLSAKNGGTPSTEEALDQILALNPQITNPDLIVAGEALVLPVYS